MKKGDLIVGGFVRSRRDGDEHVVSALRLKDLYRVGDAPCRMITRDTDWRGICVDDDVVLRPRFDGDYTLPPLAG